MAYQLKYDEIGYWSEIKLDIIKEYASAYSRIMSSQTSPQFYHLYVDAFAGSGKHISKSTGEFVSGSPENALLVEPPFREYHFIDLDKQKIESLEKMTGPHKNIYIYHGDCNHVMLDSVFPRAKYKNYRRALCVLDPYGLHLNWEVISKAGQMKSVEIFLNFPVADINRNVLWRKPENVSPSQIERMNKFWGDDSWHKEAYALSKQINIFGEEELEKASNQQIAAAFRKRLINVAGFTHVPEPIAMRNSQNAIIYYLFFASQKPVAGGIVKHIFNKYANKRGN